MRINHIEVSVPLGALTPEFVARADRLLVDVFGWSREPAAAGGSASVRHKWRLPSDQSIVVYEAASPLRVDGDDHVGLEVSRSELARIFDGCRELAASDPAVEFLHLDDGRPAIIPSSDGSAYSTFFVRYVLPLWMQFEAREPAP